LAEDRAELPRAQVSWQDREQDERLEQVMHARIAETQPGDLLSVRRHERFVHAAKRGFAGQGIAGGAWDAQEAAVGATADVAELGQMAEGAADRAVAGVVDRGLGAQGAPCLVIGFDPGVFVVEVERGDDPVADDPGAEAARGGFMMRRSKMSWSCEGWPRVTLSLMICSKHWRPVSAGRRPASGQTRLEDRQVVGVAGGRSAAGTGAAGVPSIGRRPRRGRVRRGRVRRGRVRRGAAPARVGAGAQPVVERLIGDARLGELALENSWPLRQTFTG